ncbi:MAG: hypothetical protein KBB55_03595, partial [Candidatus Buchananbacteria bacterium]|nr:hypothetical protein [Candidatus Buchananbacteria bacterium]
MNKADQLERVQKLYQLFHDGAIPVLSNHEVNPQLPKDSRENYLYFTLAPSLNFQRSSPALWVAALKTYEDPETQYLFFPEKVVEVAFEKVQSDLQKYKLSLQKNKHTQIWITLSKAFHSHYKSDPRELFEAATWDVINIHQIIQKEKHKDFPYISGPKMANYWLYILSQYTDAKFKNMDAISIIPDTHVLQCSIQLGLTDSLMAPIKVAEVW